MSHMGPGTYVLFTDPKDANSPWPGVVFVDGDGPQDVQDRRPPGYVTLVLLMGEPYRFRWASSLRISPLTTSEQVSSPEHSKEIRTAVQQAIFMREIGLGLDHWKGEVVTQFGRNPSSDLEWEPEHEDEEVVGTVEELDEQHKLAIRISKEQFDRSSALAVRTPSSSPRPRPRRGGARTEVVHVNADSDHAEDLELYTPPSPRIYHFASPKRTHPSRYREDSARSLRTLSDREESPRKRQRGPNADTTSSSPTQRRNKSSEYQGRSALQCMQSFNQNSATPTSDTVDNDLEQSKAFVHIPFGPDEEIHTLQKKDVWDRSYFRNPGAGINYFAMDDEGNWVLRHPKLARITAEDFRFVSDYLTRNDFGIQYPENYDENQKAIAQCVAAYETAENLGMNDMQEHIAEKVKFLEWELTDVLTFAIIIYRSGPSLHEEDQMRDWASGYIAQHYFAYLKDDAIATVFYKKIRMLKALWKDVLVKLLQITERGDEMEEEQEQESDMDDFANYDDL